MWCGIWFGASPLTSDSGVGSCPTVAQIWTHTLPNGQSARAALAQAADLLLQPVQGAFTMVDVLRILAAVAAGKTRIVDNGDGTAHVEFDAIDESGLVVEAEMTGSERTAVTLTPNESS